MRNMYPEKKESISKGYRLQPETHELVETIRKAISGTKDDVISRACRSMYNSLLRNEKNKKKNNT